MRWIKRNEDKPHRCPLCHAMARGDFRGIGPKTVLKCPLFCNVKWRYGSRGIRFGMAFYQGLEGKRLFPLYCYTTQRFGCLTRMKKSG